MADRADIDKKVTDDNEIVMVSNYIEQGDDIKIACVRGVVNVVIALIDGKIVYSAQHVADVNNNVVVDSNELQAGLYIVAISDEHNHVCRGRLLVE